MTREDDENEHRHHWEVLFDGMFTILMIPGHWVCKRCACGLVSVRRYDTWR